MSNKVPNGGSEFPLAYKCGINEVCYTNGMAMRDWFAGQALAGDIGGLANSADPKRLAQYAYAVADAMLAARSGT